MTEHHLVLERQPRFIPLSDYEQAGSEIEGSLGALSGLVAIYRTGAVSAPGISDIDRIAVVERFGRFPSVWHHLPEHIRHIAMHSPFLVDADTFARHRWFAMPEPLTVVTGTEITVEQPPLDRLGVINGIEGLIVCRLKLQKQLDTRRLKVRPLLCELHNVRHDLRIAQISSDAAPRAWKMCEEVFELRTCWWETSESERRRRFVELAMSAPSAIDEALAGFTTVVDQNSARTTPLSLGAAWKKVALTEQPGLNSRTSALSVQRSLAAVSRRAGELAWRSRKHELNVPPSVLSLLWSAATGGDQLMDERRRIVRNYGAFMARQSADWSSIGLAGIFTNP